MSKIPIHMRLSLAIEKWYQNDMAITANGCVISDRMVSTNANRAAYHHRMYVARSFCSQEIPDKYEPRTFPTKRYGALMNKLFMTGRVSPSDTTPATWRLLLDLLEVDTSEVVGFENIYEGEQL